MAYCVFHNICLEDSENNIDGFMRDRMEENVDNKNNAISIIRDWLFNDPR